MSKRGWNLLKCLRVGQYVIDGRWFLQGSIVYALMELAGVGFAIKKAFQATILNRQ
jgi:hypothetical protein